MSKLSRKDLEELVQAQIIDGTTADKISNFYQQQKNDNPGRLNAVLGILGALLAGLGIILVIAHNWDELNRTVKTFLSFLPLILGQGLCIFTLIKRSSSASWREISSVLLFFGVGASISLISQLYHIDGKLSEFLLTWMMLTVPLVYLMRSSVTAMLVLVGITWYAYDLGYGYRSEDVPILYIVFLATLVPHYFSVNPLSNYYHLLNWVASISLLIALGSFSGRWHIEEKWIRFTYLSLLCVFYLYGKSEKMQLQPFWANPFRLLGMAGILILLFIGSFNWSWEQWSKGISLHNIFYAPTSSPLLYISLVFSIIALVLIVKNKEIKSPKNTDPTGLSFIIYLLGLFIFDKIDNSAIFIVNFWILAIAVYFINRGAALSHLGILNFGLLVILILAVCRFFDDWIPFVWRGIFFLATGISFFVTNYLLLKKRKKLQAQ